MDASACHLSYQQFHDGRRLVISANKHWFDRRNLRGLTGHFWERSAQFLEKFSTWTKLVTRRFYSAYILAVLRII